MRSLVISRWKSGRLNSGTALRNSQNMAALAQLGPVDVIVVDPKGNIPECAPLPGTTQIGEYVPAPAPHIPGRWVLPGPHHMVRRYTDPQLIQRLRSLSPADYDVALVEEISLSAYVEPLVSAGIRTVFDAHNVEARLWADIGHKDGAPKAGLAALRQNMFNRKLHQAEKNAVNTADIVWACSALDAQLMDQLYQPKKPVSVVPNAIDVDAYAEARNQRMAHPDTSSPLLVYIGTYSYAPNEVAALRLISEILPALRESGVNLELAIVGRDPTAAMQQAAAQDPAVTITGGVDSIMPYLAQQSISVMPITIGGGTRLKVLEAFAAQCPVISTAKGVEGIDVHHEKNVWLAETTEDFVTGIRHLAENPETCARIGQGGFETVRQSYSWQTAARDVAATLTGSGS